jgi:Zn-finger nucleic acid-binding protein
MFRMCPACREAMVVFELEGVQVDRCLSCGGTWLDAGELEELAVLAGGTPGRMAELLEQGGGEKRGDRRCVRCPGKLRAVAFEGVEIDRCAQGHGLWFDRDEIGRLMSKFTDGEEGRVARFLSDLFAAEQKKGD